ncbi:hypothetical protein [Winogradskyella marincola]|uniref:Uncharacterized protein n=1 Tax=Winogradskyella marincola TaxID=3037795 RepID=A0ABT6G3M1_9FLAO|nr:hypothetical protein [Winogradskyella sp. YYF002]MDG4716626.1 hypothetical protein [Winogradskyella sp. YYF002]
MKIFSLLFLLVFSTCIFAQVGVGTTEPKSTLDINGNLSVKVVSLVGNGTGTQTNAGSTVEIDDGVYISVNPQVQDDTFELPNPSEVPGRVYFIRNVNPTNTITAKIVTDTGQLFSSGSTTNGSNEIYLYESGSDFRKSVIVISDGANWTYFFGLL